MSSVDSNNKGTTDGIMEKRSVVLIDSGKCTTPTKKESLSTKSKKKKTNKGPRKCIVCKKKKLTNMKCRCKTWTCLSHMHNHDCTFDWQEFQRDKQNKELIKVEFSKVNRI